MVWRQDSGLSPGCSPAPVEESFNRGKESLVHGKSDDDDDEHDTDDLVHRIQLTPIMQQMSQAESGENRHEDFCRHE